MQKTIKLSLTLGALLSQLHATDANNKYTLDAIRVTAAQGATLDTKDVTDSVTIITKEALEESRITSLDEALNKLAGISMTQNGGAGKSTSMFLRGMDTRRLLVLIDGVRHNDPATLKSTADFSKIMLYNVEQIEIIKGAQSGVWGSEASGGVINIITSKAKKGLHGILNVEYGSFGTTNTSLQASYAEEKFDILIGGLSFKTAGFSAVEAKQSEADYGKRYDELGLEKDLYENESINAKLGYNFTDDDRIEAMVQATNGITKYDAFAGVSGDSTTQQSVFKNRLYTLAYKHKDNLNDLKLQYNLSTFDREDTYGNYIGSIEEFKVDDKISYMKDSFLRIGASYQKAQSKEVTVNKEDKDYNTQSIFVTNYNKFKLIANQNTIITESIRYDKYSDYDNSLTGKLGLKQFIMDDFYISTNIGTGYNVPTMSQLYNQYWGNIDLKPEKSLTSDITIGNNTVWVTGFYNKITDLIDYNFSTFTYTQIDGTSRFKGIELGYEDYYFNSLGISAMYTYTDTEDVNGKALARRPKIQIDATLTYYITEAFDIGLSSQYIGERFDKADNQGAQTGKYLVSNLVSNYKVNKKITLYGKIDNITDKYYQTVDGYATAERSYYIGLNAKF
ncbi:MAG: TonB-dependent receptor [Sulfurimonas sp.]|nr:TonB-dependent receptor [Sulfurimonas sp.]